MCCEGEEWCSSETRSSERRLKLAHAKTVHGPCRLLATSPPSGTLRGCERLTAATAWLQYTRSRPIRCGRLPDRVCHDELLPWRDGRAQQHDQPSNWVPERSRQSLLVGSLERRCQYQLSLLRLYRRTTQIGLWPSIIAHRKNGQHANTCEQCADRDSNFSPVPSRVMDGSEPGETTPAAVLSGAPIELQARTVRYIHSLTNLLTPSFSNPARTASTKKPNPPPNPATGTTTTGAWTGTCCPRATGGRTR